MKISISQSMIKALTKLFCHWIHIGKRFVVSVRKNKKKEHSMRRTQQNRRKEKLFLVIQLS